MRRSAEMPDQTAQDFLAVHCLRYVGDDHSGEYQRWERGGADGVLFASGSPLPWCYWWRDGGGRMWNRTCLSLMDALARLRAMAVVSEAPAE